MLLTALGLAVGQSSRYRAVEAPLHAYLGGSLGVLFVAGTSWLILRIGAVRRIRLLISGQMLSGALFAIIRACRAPLGRGSPVWN